MAEDKAEYVRLTPYLNQSKNLAKEIKILLTVVRKYYDKYPTKDSVGRDDLKPFFDIQFPQHQEAETYYTLIDNMYNMEVSDEVVEEITEHFQEESSVAKIFDIGVPTLHGQKHGIMDKIKAEVDEYYRNIKNPPEVDEPNLEPCELTVVEMVENRKQNPAWSTGIQLLDETIGGIERKSLGLIYAYVDTGKTSLAMNIASELAKQMKGTENLVLYCGNEEDSERLRWRMSQAFTKWDKDELENDPVGAVAICAVD
jgi:replicative DNA helicase